VAKPGTEQVEGEELLAPRGRAPYLDKLTDDDGDGDKLAVGAEADGAAADSPSRAARRRRRLA
jgi:hypothetical protein